MTKMPDGGKHGVTVPVLGHGIYTFAEASRLTQLSNQRVRTWFRGRDSSANQRRSEAVFRSDYGQGRAISFLDLIEVLVAGHMREAGMSLQLVRRAHQLLIQDLGTPHPFCHQGLLTDGKRLFLLLEEEAKQDKQLIDVLQRQHAIPNVLLPYLERLVYEDGGAHLAIRWNIAEGVVVDPARSYGKPIVMASAMPAAVLAAAYSANRRDAAAVADWYGVGVDDVMSAVRFQEEYFGEAA